MRILIVAGIFEPEIGGPATYARKLAWPDTYVTVVTFSSVLSSPGDSDREHLKIVRVFRGNKFLNRIRFFWKVNELLRNEKFDIVYMFDWFAAGLPAALVAKVRGVPYVVRVGGDYLWEQRYLESDAPPISLSDFYEHGLHHRLSYRPFFWLIRGVLLGAQHVVFNSDRQRELYGKYYGLRKTSVIYNPVPGMTRWNPEWVSASKEFVFWGRFIVMKNLTTLIRAFAKARLPEGYTLTLIGDGPRRKEIQALVSELGVHDRVNIIGTMSRGEAWDRVKDSRALVLPSWTDISPNIVYEALAMGLPALVTKENYLSIRNRLPETIDPNSIDDISAKLEMLADDGKYRAFTEAFRAISFQHTWDDVAHEHLKIFSAVTGKKL